MSFREDFLKKAMMVWESPLNGNAVVLLHAARDFRSARAVVVADLDSGEVYLVDLSELKVAVRKSEASDYGFSFSADHDPEILSMIEDDT
jgi:hypothetical protein